MSNSFQAKSIEIKNLILWDENARFSNKYSEVNEIELIDLFLSNPKLKIDLLLDEIVNDFDIPQLEKIVVWNNDNNFVVLEGNRRLTCFKILANPDFINEKHIKLKEKVNTLKEKIEINENFKVECLISNEKNDCFRYIDRKHNKGNNEVPWNQPERENFSILRGDNNYTVKLRHAISNYIRELDLPKEIINTVLGKGYVTNLYRLTTTGPARKKFNLSLNEDGSLKFDVESNFSDKLKNIVLEVFENKKINGQSLSRRYNKSEQIEKLLDTIPENKDELERKIEKFKEKNIFGQEAIIKPAETLKDKKPKVKEIIPKSTERKYLIPRNCRITIKSNKINDIYRELRDDLLLDNSKNAVQNAVGVLFRVFLEISLDEYAEKNMKIFKKTDTIKQKIPWVIKSLQEKGYDTKTFKEINKVGSASNEKSFLSIERFHEYVHSKTVMPSPTELKTKWNLLQPFFELLWDDLNSKN